MFQGISPREAEQQDPALVERIADYRAARHAVALFNRGKEGVDELNKHPSLIGLLQRMQKAQLED